MTKETKAPMVEHCGATARAWGCWQMTASNHVMQCQMCPSWNLEIPATVVFWRPSEEIVCRHRRPLFSAALGLSIFSLTIDALHALYLGVMNKWCSIAIWLLISSGVYGASGSGEEHLRNSVLLMRHALMSCYGERRQEHPAQVLTRLNDLTPKMLGTKTAPKCKAKGAETWGLLLFLIAMLQKHAYVVGVAGARLHRAGSSLVRMVEIWDNSGRVLSPADREEHDTHNKLT